MAEDAEDDDNLPQRVDELEPLSLLVEKLERSRTKSTAVLRGAAYQLLAQLGIDVSRLVKDARDTLMAEAKRRAKHTSRRRELIKLRIAKNEIPVEKMPAALRALESAPRLIKAHKRVLKQIAARLPVPPTDPTLERRRHAAEDVEEVKIQPPDQRWTVAKRFNWPVDHIADLLTGPEYEAAQQYRWAHENRVARPKTSNYDGVGDQRDPARRLPITPTQQKASAEWAMWQRHIPPAIQPILDNFVLELPRGNTGRPLGRVDFGKRYAHCASDHQARGMSDGMLKVACGVLASIWRQYSDWIETQRALIRAAAENEKIKHLIAQGALDLAAREIEAETRAHAQRSARGVAPAMALDWLEAERVKEQVFRKRGD